MTRTLTQRLWVARLIDAYGRMLTAHQQRLLRLYYLDDLSLSEIARRTRVSRQAVFDGLRRAVEELKRTEASLGIVHGWDRSARRQRRVQARLDALERAIARLDGQAAASVLGRVSAALAAVRRAII